MNKLPHEIEIVFSSCIRNGRNRPEKQMALALLKGGVQKLKLSDSYWAGEPKNVDGCLLSTLSIQATGGIYIRNRHILWAILDRLRLRFSGGAKEEEKWAQASWHPKQDGYASYYHKNMNLPLVVCYFNQLKELI